MIKNFNTHNLMHVPLLCCVVMLYCKTTKSEQKKVISNNKITFGILLLTGKLVLVQASCELRFSLQIPKANKKE